VSGRRKPIANALHFDMYMLNDMAGISQLVQRLCQELDNREVVVRFSRGEEHSLFHSVQTALWPDPASHSVGTYLLTYLLTPWSRVLLQKLTGSQLVKKFPALMEPEGSLPHSQVPETCPYPEPAQSSPYQFPLPEDTS